MQSIHMVVIYVQYAVGDHAICQKVSARVRENLVVTFSLGTNNMHDKYIEVVMLLHP